MSFRTFMGSIGNAFKTGWNNGNIQKGMAITGMAAFGVGMTANLVHDMKRGGSIFSGGCGCNSFGFGGNMFGCSPFSMGGMDMFGSSPFSMMGSMNMFGTGNMFGGGMDMFGGMNMLNGMGNMYGMGGMSNMGSMMAYQWGQMLRLQLESQQGMQSGALGLNNGLFGNTGEVTDEMLDSIVPRHEYNDEEGIISDKTKGQAFDEGTDDLKNKSNAEAVVLSDKTLSENKTEYINGLSTTAKSYISSLDSNEDGHISEEEFIEHEVEKAKAELEEKGQEMTEQQETNLRNSLRIVFAQMDMNRSGYIDWKEMTSTMATYDAGGSILGTSRGDGKITASEYKSAQTKLTSANGAFGKINWRNYTQLFDNPESE